MSIEEIRKELDTINDLSANGNYDFNRAMHLLERVVDDLELYEKLFDVTLRHMRQAGGTICLFEGCPNCDINEDGFCGGNCPTVDELKEYLFEEAKVELENERIHQQ